LSWEQIGSIYKEAVELRRKELQTPPVACPIDGDILVWRNGIGNCPMGNFRTSKSTPSGR